MSSEELAALAGQVFERDGTMRFVSRGSSMWPLIRSGDVLTLEPVAGRALHIGEVGLFRGPTGRLIAHRLVRKIMSGAEVTLRFRGDARLHELETVAPNRVLARVTAVERRGRQIYLQSNLSRLWALVWRVVSPVGVLTLNLGGALRQRALSLGASAIRGPLGPAQ